MVPVIGNVALLAATVALFLTTTRLDRVRRR